jgi:protein involved in ribonucleotide reduction
MIYPYFLNERPVEPPTTPPRIKAAHQVSNVMGMLRAGNKVFNDQIVATGPRIRSKAIRANASKYFIV